jgi:hypothetical protein
MKDIHWFKRATMRSETVIYDDEDACIVFVGSLLEQVPGSMLMAAIQTAHIILCNPRSPVQTPS